MKHVQIPEDLFFDLCHYHLFADQLDASGEEILIQAITNGLKSKLEAMQRRAAYSAYKDTKATPEARQEARKAYLDMIGMLPGYRWDNSEPPA